MAGDHQAACACLAEGKENVVLEEKIKPRPGLTNNHSPPPQPLPPARAQTGFLFHLPSPDCLAEQCGSGASLAGRWPAWAFLGQAFLGQAWAFLGQAAVSRTLDPKVTSCPGWSFSHLPLLQAPTPHPHALLCKEGWLRGKAGTPGLSSCRRH